MAVEEKTAETVLHLYSEIFTPGDIADQLTVLLVKLEKLSSLTEEQATDLRVRAFAAWQLLFILMEEESIIDSGAAHIFLKDLTDLLRSNRNQWDLEDQVIDKKDISSALVAREQNTHRVELKNKINILFNYSEELKKYGNR